MSQGILIKIGGGGRVMDRRIDQVKIVWQHDMLELNHRFNAAFSAENKKNGEQRIYQKHYILISATHFLF